MKAIISHDVDHITVFEHWKDLIILKYFIRSFIELLIKRITWKEFNFRIQDIYRNKWQNISDLIEFDKKNNIQSTFFIAVSKGRGLSYSLKNAEKWIKKIHDLGFEVGVHGIAYGNYYNIKHEYNMFKKVANIPQIGIRMHYLKKNSNTLENLNKVGYLYDTTIFEIKNPFRIGNMWEFPLQIMDGYIIQNKSKWQNINLEMAKIKTIDIIIRAQKLNIEYLTILFHDRYFCESFSTWKNWYIWLIKYLKENNIPFISYTEAVFELTKKV
jgi:peptidoglycan/xylan/chitin deacetylase (PgdA/CDA1 family)